MNSTTVQTFNNNTFISYCDILALKDIVLQNIIVYHDIPALRSRIPGFESLVHIIPEQQVSLASTRGTYNKLKETLPEITPLIF